MSKAREYTKIEENSWIISFYSLFAKGVDSVKETVEKRFENKIKEENFDSQIKLFFLKAAKDLFNGKTTVSKEKVDSIKLLFQDSSTLKGLQTDFSMNVTGETDGDDV